MMVDILDSSYCQGVCETFRIQYVYHVHVFFFAYPAGGEVRDWSSVALVPGAIVKYPLGN